MLIVFFGDKPGGEYEELLDVLFLASGLLSPTGHISGKPKLGSLSESASNNLRAGICLILEETLLTLEAGLARSGDRFEVPKYFQKEEAEEVDSEQPGAKPVKGQSFFTYGSERHLSIYKFGLSVCLSVCLYPINVKTAEPIGPKFFVGHLGTPGKVMNHQNFKYLSPSKFDRH